MLDKSSYHTKAYIIGKLKSKNRNCQIKYNCWSPQGSVLDTNSCVLSFSGYTRILDIAISTEEWQNSMHQPQVLRVLIWRINSYVYNIEFL